MQYLENRTFICNRRGLYASVCYLKKKKNQVNCTLLQLLQKNWKKKNCLWKWQVTFLLPEREAPKPCGEPGGTRSSSLHLSSCAWNGKAEGLSGFQSQPSPSQETAARHSSMFRDYSDLSSSTIGKALLQFCGQMHTSGRSNTLLSTSEFENHIPQKEGERRTSKVLNKNDSQPCHIL